MTDEQKDPKSQMRRLERAWKTGELPYGSFGGMGGSPQYWRERGDNEMARYLEESWLR